MTTSIRKPLMGLLFIHYSLLFSVALTSCADSDMEQLSMQEPETLAAYDYLKAYDVLKSYSNHIGVTMDAQTFLDKGMEYRIAVSNFTELVPTATFSHARTMKANGSFDSTAIVAVKQLAGQHGMHLIGSPLIWHQQQNVTYLNACIAPNVIRPEGDDGGYCLKMTNTAMSSSVNQAQVAYTFAKTPQVEPGISYKLKMMVRGTSEGKVQVQTWSNGKGSRFTPEVAVTKEWTKVEIINTIASGIKGLTSILFNVGQYVGTLYVDDIELVEWNASRQKEIGKNLNTVNTNLDNAEQTATSLAIQTDANGTLEEVSVSALGEGYDPLATYVDKTDAEKRDILSAEMQRYIAAAMEAGGMVTSDWIVVSDPLATVTDDASMFYWQQYLGQHDYAVQAFKTAAQHTNGKLYIGISGLAENLAMCQQLATYMQAIEAQGARVDGIAVNIEANTESTNIEQVRQMFKQFAATGKLVRIADLQVTVGDGIKTEDMTEQQLKQQSTLMAEVLKAYTSEVPVSQQGGVILHQTLDTTLPLGLWNRSYERKHAYGAVCALLVKSE